MNSVQVFVVLALWNNIWALNVFAITWNTSVLSAAFVDLVDSFTLGSLASNSLVSAFSLGSSDIVDSAAGVDSAWIVLESPALTVGSLATSDINTDNTWCKWSHVSDWSLGDSLGGSAWSSSVNVWSDSDLAASSDWTASVGIDNSSSVSSWASFFTEMEALLLVAFARILVAAAVIIDWSADEVLVAFTSWTLVFWALWALLLWDLRAEWSRAALVDRVSSALEGTLGTLLNWALLLGALNVSGSDTAAALTLRDSPLLTIASWLTFMINTNWWFKSGGDGNAWCGSWWSLGGCAGGGSSSTVGNWSLGSVLAWDALGNWAALVSGDDLFVTLWALSFSEIAALALVADASVCAATFRDLLSNAVFIVFACWWLEVADNSVALDVSAESDIATSVSSLLDASLLSLHAGLHWGALSLGTSDLSVGVALAVSAGLW